MKARVPLTDRFYYDGELNYCFVFGRVVRVFEASSGAFKKDLKPHSGEIIDMLFAEDYVRRIWAKWRIVTKRWHKITQEG